MMSCGWQDMTVQLMFLSHSYGRYTQRLRLMWTYQLVGYYSVSFSE
jgi:hypothetical protein